MDNKRRLIKPRDAVSYGRRIPRFNIIELMHIAAGPGREYFEATEKPRYCSRGHGQPNLKVIINPSLLLKKR